MMQRMILLLLLVGVVGVGAYWVGNMAAENARLKEQLASGKASPRPAAPAAPGASATPGPARRLTEGQRAALIDALREETGPVKKIWFRVDPNDAEASTFERALEDAFKEAGWEVTRAGSDGLMFKPGIYLLVGDEDWPSYAETANKALEAAGIGVTAARGYKAYYEEMTRTKPDWRGTKFLPDQTYVVLIGRKPEATS